MSLLEQANKSDGQKPMVDYNEKIAWRKNNAPPKRTRMQTRHPSLDQWFGGGLPKGLTLLFGNAGCGKSKLGRHIAMKADNAAYIACEVLNDAPSPLEIGRAHV